MFEDFDDPLPPAPAPVDGVMARGRRLRTQRRMLAGAAVMFVLAGGIATAAALQGGSHKRVIVSDASTTTVATSVPDTDSTATTASTGPDPTTTPSSIAVITPAPSVSTTTQPPHDPKDLSMVSVTWPAGTAGDFGNCLDQPACHNSLDMYAGASVPVTYTVTNNGTWTVELNTCTGPGDIWAENTAGGFGQYDQVWPAPYPTRGTGEVTVTCADGGVTFLNPGRSTTETDTILAGYRDAVGDVMPSSLGATSFTPSFLPQCAQPCRSLRPNALLIRVVPPAVAALPFHVTVKTMSPTAASGHSTQVEITYDNPLAFAVRTPLFGPCWTVKSGIATVDCSGALPALIIGPHASVDLVGTVWARAGFKATGAPLAPGTYEIDLGDQYGSATSSPGFPAPVFTAT